MYASKDKRYLEGGYNNEEESGRPKKGSAKKYRDYSVNNRHTANRS